MDLYRGIKGREDLITELVEKYSAKSAESVILIQANRGQGKSFITNELIKKLSHKEFNIFLNAINEFQAKNYNEGIKKINAFGISGGIASISLGFSMGWNNPSSQYEKIRCILASWLKKDVLLCVDGIENISDELRFLTLQIIKNIHRLERDFDKKIFLFITSIPAVFTDNLLGCTVSSKIIELPKYSASDIAQFFKLQKKLMEVNVDKIYSLCHGNLNLADFLYDELCVQNNKYLDTLNDVVKRRLAILKEQGEKKELSSNDIEEIIFSAALAIKKFTAQLIKNIVEKKVPLIIQGLDMACEESLMEKDSKKFYGFTSDEIQEDIEKMSIQKREDLLISYYNYYTQCEPDEYYIRAHYIYKFQGNLSNFSETLFLLAFIFAKKMSDEAKVKMIENIFSSSNEEERRFRFNKIKNFLDNITNNESLSIIDSAYNDFEYMHLDITVLAELTCEYFGVLYRKTSMSTPNAFHILNKCIGYAQNNLIVSNTEIEGLLQIDEKILRLKIIYDIAPCVLDQKNDYETFQKLYDLSKELRSNHQIGVKQNNLCEYVENVFNRKAFLFVNQASCDFYYEKAKRYFASHEIWIEYYITLVCQAGTYIVIQEFKKAIDICIQVTKECEEQRIILPQIEKLNNNQSIAEFLLTEQQSKNTRKVVSVAKKTISKLKKLINNEANATQFVIYTNICSLSLYVDDIDQYNKFKNKLEKLYKCKDIADIRDESVDDFYRYYFAWFDLYCNINGDNWQEAERIANSLNNFVPALFRKQEVFWEEKLSAVKKMIHNKEKKNAYDFCNNLVQTKRQEQILSKFFYRGLMLSDLQYTSYF